jgi:hypothetical protein
MIVSFRGEVSSSGDQIGVGGVPGRGGMGIDGTDCCLLFPDVEKGLEGLEGLWRNVAAKSWIIITMSRQSVIFPAPDQVS